MGLKIVPGLGLGSAGTGQRPAGPRAGPPAFGRSAGKGPRHAEFESDVVARQALSLGEAITRIDDLRRFSADALFSLPDATLVADAERPGDRRQRRRPGLFKPRARSPGCWTAADWPTLINALEPAGPNLFASWTGHRATDRHDPIDLHLADGRAFQMQTVFRRDEARATARAGSCGWPTSRS
jgi:hypothetical protein